MNRLSRTGGFTPCSENERLLFSYRIVIESGNHRGSEWSRIFISRLLLERTRPERGEIRISNALFPRMPPERVALLRLGRAHTGEKPAANLILTARDVV